MKQVFTDFEIMETNGNTEIKVLASNFENAQGWETVGMVYRDSQHIGEPNEWYITLHETKLSGWDYLQVKNNVQSFLQGLVLSI